MTPPFIHKEEESKDLSGESGASSWIKGHNCVYESRDGPYKYRVAIRSKGNWINIGFFDDLGAASYIANVAILAYGEENKYQLNKIERKDKTELANWRSSPLNAKLEQIARQKHESLIVERMAKEEEAARAKADRKRIHDEKVAYIKSLQNPKLVEFIRSTNKYDPYHLVAEEEAIRRLQKMGLRSAP